MAAPGGYVVAGGGACLPVAAGQRQPNSVGNARSRNDRRSTELRNPCRSGYLFTIGAGIAVRTGADRLQLRGRLASSKRGSTLPLELVEKFGNPLGIFSMLGHGRKLQQSSRRNDREKADSQAALSR
ncbi:hypothetical protein WR25_18261 [Diploscapter pachys]|uniref:Uncharacterized protein n=1 Tax=Diploscapter pachys TaxID=2018661 RepID=A0A2A2M2T1_9BILA|nr:hypothetical protein WR25_18261 [Diploscapter pachys]